MIKFEYVLKSNFNSLGKYSCFIDIVRRFVERDIKIVNFMLPIF